MEIVSNWILLFNLILGVGNVEELTSIEVFKDDVKSALSCIIWLDEPNVSLRILFCASRLSLLFLRDWFCLEKAVHVFKIRSARLSFFVGSLKAYANSW